MGFLGPSLSLRGLVFRFFGLGMLIFFVFVLLLTAFLPLFG